MADDGTRRRPFGPASGLASRRGRTEARANGAERREASLPTPSRGLRDALGSEASGSGGTGSGGASPRSVSRPRAVAWTQWSGRPLLGVVGAAGAGEDFVARSQRARRAPGPLPSAGWNSSRRFGHARLLEPWMQVVAEALAARGACSRLGSRAADRLPWPTAWQWGEPRPEHGPPQARQRGGLAGRLASLAKLQGRRLAWRLSLVVCHHRRKSWLWE